MRFDAETLALAAALLELRTAAPTLQGLAAACQEILARAGSPLLAAAGCDRIGTNTNGPIVVRLHDKDEVVAFIKQGM